MAHDEEIDEHGSDIRFAVPIGHFGKIGITAALDHLSPDQLVGVNGRELLFTAAVAATDRGYRMCDDPSMVASFSRKAGSSDRVDKRESFLISLRDFCATN